jgi:hypothetical protein
MLAIAEWPPGKCTLQSCNLFSLVFTMNPLTKVGDTRMVVDLTSNNVQQLFYFSKQNRPFFKVMFKLSGLNCFSLTCTLSPQIDYVHHFLPSDPMVTRNLTKSYSIMAQKVNIKFVHLCTPENLKKIQGASNSSSTYVVKP